MKKKVLITRAVSEKELAPLYEKYDVEMNTLDRDYTYEELTEKVKGKDAVLCMLSNKIDAALMDSEPKVKIFANYAVGYNNLHVEDGKGRGVYLSNTPGVLTDATADLAWALLFSVARRVVPAHAFTSEGKFVGWEPKMYLGKDIYGKKLGIVGAGRIGQAFAKRSKGFDMEILYYNRTRKPEFEKETGAKYVTMEELLQESDYVSLHTPLTQETKHLIDADALKMMKSSAILINTARGPVIDEKALVKALEEGEIWGAGLDVYEQEPILEAELMKMDNVVILPHIGSATEETRDAMVKLAVDNIVAVLEGNEPLTNVY